MGRRLSRRFFARPATEVARDLLGTVLVRPTPGGTRLAARIVEAEAYEERDPASHSFRGETARNAVMFGPPGRVYVYFTYGMHFCMNAVTGAEGEGSAVLIRAAEPLEGLEEMAARRGTDLVHLLCSGPARLCRAFDVDRTLNGVDLVAPGPLMIERGRSVPDAEVASGPRVGIRRGTERHWRFSIAGNPFVSPGRPVAGRAPGSPPTG